MKHRPIHENLDTSFVNLSALVRYLRRRQFVGKVRVELSGYEADIFLGEANHLRALEHDRIAGRIAEGEEALQRILIRSREPGGIVGVFQEVSETEEIAAKAGRKTTGANLAETAAGSKYKTRCGSNSETERQTANSTRSYRRRAAETAAHS